MSKLIIGDSHIIRLRKTLPYDIPVDECYWGGEPYPKNYKIPTCDYEHLLRGGGLKEKVYFSAHKGRHAWGSNIILNELCQCIKEVVKRNTFIFPSFGYIDSKVQLVKHKNPKEAVERYVNGFLDTFPNNKIRFVEPIPQFINNLGTGPDIYDFKDRYPMHKEFVLYLRELLHKLNLDEPISPEKIFDVDKFDDSYECHECDYCLDPTSLGIKWDHLKPEYNKQLLDAILKN